MKIDFMGMSIDATNTNTMAQQLMRRLSQEKASIVFTPNAVMSERARRDESFRKALMRADFRVPDGMGVVLAARLMGLSLRERVPGIELGEAVLARLSQIGGRVFFLGGAPGVASRAAQEMRRKYPGLTVVGTHHGYFSDKDSSAICRCIARTRPHFLAVCLGSPRQEEWVASHMSELSAIPIIITLGGSLDVWSGDLRRAPLPFRQAGLEWLWRMLRQPRRFKDAPAILSLLFAAARVGAIEKKGQPQQLSATFNLLYSHQAPQRSRQRCNYRSFSTRSAH